MKEYAQNVENAIQEVIQILSTSRINSADHGMSSLPILLITCTFLSLKALCPANACFIMVAINLSIHLLPMPVAQLVLVSTISFGRWSSLLYF